MPAVREAPSDGHTILLMQKGSDRRTMSHYNNLATCLDKISDMYENSRTNPLDRTSYDLDKLWIWIGQFERFVVFIYDAEISRYKMTSDGELKDLIIKEIVAIDEQLNGSEIEFCDENF